MAKIVGRARQAALGQDSEIFVPKFSYDDFVILTSAEETAGQWEEIKQEEISNSEYAESLDSRRGVWTSAVTETWEMDVRRNMREQMILWGAYDTSSAYPLNPEAGVYDHRVVPSFTTRHYLTGVYTDDDGSVYTHTSQEPASCEYTFGERYIVAKMQLFGQHVSHCQVAPTTSFVSYLGRAYVRSVPIDNDAAALTYNIAVDTAGTIDGSTAKLKSKKSTDAGFGAARAVTNNDPWLIEDQNGAFSGMELMLTRGQVAASGNALNIADTITVSTRGTAPSASYISGQTVFVPRKYEAALLLDNAAPDKRPKNITINVSRGIRNDDHGIGTDVTNSHPLGPGFLVSGSFTLEKTDQRFDHLSTHLRKIPFKLTFNGDYVGSSVVYRQLLEWQFDNIQIGRVPRSMIKDPRIPVVTVPWVAKPTTQGGLDGMYFRARNAVTTYSL